MVSIAFVNGKPEDSFTQVAIEMVSINESIKLESFVNKYIDGYDRFMFESGINFSNNNDEKVITEAGKNIFEKIGDAIINLFKKMKDFIDSIIIKINNRKFENKDYENKLNALAKGDPTLKEDIINKFKSADLNITDMKSLKEFQSTYNSLVELSKKKDIDPKSFKGKVNAFKEKFKDIDKSAVIKTVSAIGTVVSVSMAIALIKKNLNDVKSSSINLNKMTKDMYDKTLDSYEELKKMDGGKFVDPDSLSKAQILQNVNMFSMNKLSRMISRDEKSSNKLTNIFKSVVDKFTKSADKSGKLIKDLDKDLSAKNRNDKKEREKLAENEYAKAYAKNQASHDFKKNNSTDDEAQKEIQAEYNKAMARAKASSDFKANDPNRETHRRYEDEDTYRKTILQARANKDFKDDNRDANLRDEYDKSYERERASYRFRRHTRQKK